MAVQNKPIPIGGMDDRDAFLIDPQYAANVRNVRSLRERITRSPGGTLLAPAPGTESGNTQNGVAMGTFVQKTTGTGTQQVPHTLGFTPQALIIFGGSSTSSTAIQDGYGITLGMTDGTLQRAHAAASLAASQITASFDAAHGARRVSNAIITMPKPGLTAGDGPTTAANATWVSYNSTSFTINWTINDNVPRTFAWVALGLSSGLSVKLQEWTYTQTTGTQSVTGVGFQPQLVWHITSYVDSLTGGPFSDGNAGGARMMIGAMTPSAQWASNMDVPTGGDVSATWVETNKSLIWGNYAVVSINGPTVLFPIFQANYVSMDADGFTVNKVQNHAPLFNDPLVMSLCIAGLPNVALGTLGQPLPTSPPVHASTTGVGFNPQFMFNVSDGTPVNNVLKQGTSYSFGATVGTVQYATALSQRQNAGPVAAQMGNTSETEIQLSSTMAEAKLVGSYYSFDPDGFTLNYTTQAEMAQPNGVYLAFNATLTSPGTERGIPRNYPDVFVGANPAVENFLLLTDKSAFYYAPSTPSTGIFLPTAEVYHGIPDLRFSWVNTQGIAAWSQGIDNIRQWDGTTFSNLVTAGTPFPAKYLIAFDDRIIAGYPTIGGIPEPTQIKWSVNGNVNNWTGTGSGALEIIETNQEPITGMFVLGDRAYIGKRHQLIELIATGTLSPVFSTAPRVSGMGILAPYSIGLAEQFAFWLGPDDVYMWDGSTLTAVGERMYHTITQFVDYEQLSLVQGAVFTRDSQYWLAVPPYIFIYDYRRDIWDWDDSQNFEAIGLYNVTPLGGPLLFTADINASDFLVVGDPLCQTTRVDFQATSWLGNPIDSYFETKDYTAEELTRQNTLGSGWRVTLWDLDSLREVRFQSAPGNIVECAVSLDRGQTWIDIQSVVVNQNGVGVAWFQRPFSQIRFRFRDYGTDAYEIRGQWGHDVETAGYQYP